MNQSLQEMLQQGWKKINEVAKEWDLEIMLIGGISIIQTFQAKYIHAFYTSLDQDTRPEFLTLSGTAIVRANILYIRVKNPNYRYALVEEGTKNYMLCKEVSS